MCFFFFFFQAEDGIRDWSVTGVQTCALPICGGEDAINVDRHQIFGHPTAKGGHNAFEVVIIGVTPDVAHGAGLRECATIAGTKGREIGKAQDQIGRASCRERV